MTPVLGQLSGQTVAVWGVGREGRAVLDALPSNCKVLIIDDDPTREDVVSVAAERNAQTLTPSEAAGSEGLDVVVRSPGVSVYRDEIVALRLAGVFVTSLLELWLPHAPAGATIGVTGTKGKSTTTSLVASLLRAAGSSVGVAGNMGVPPTRIEPCDFAVLEVSSYQAAGLRESPDIGVLTNLDYDHLSWHGDKLQYHRDKLQLFTNSRLRKLIVPPWATEQVEATGVSLCWERFPYSVEADRSLLQRDGQVVVDLTGSAVAPLHMAHNLAVACSTVEHALDSRLDSDVIEGVVRTFDLLRGRLEVVPTQDGVTWVNDPLASNPMAAAAAIQTYNETPLVLIIGGQDRGVDPTPLVNAVRDHGNVRTIIALGAAGAAFRPALEPHAEVTTTGTLEGAVAAAVQTAQAGDAVLFSPGAPTPTAEGDWETRMHIFSSGVRCSTTSTPDGR